MVDYFWIKMNIQVTPFRPLAYYDLAADALRIEFRDCSLTETYINRFIVQLEDNHPRSDQHRVVGLMINNVRFLFEQLELPIEGIIRIKAVLDKLKERFPGCIDEWVYKLVSETDLMAELNQDEPPPEEGWFYNIRHAFWLFRRTRKK